MDLACIWHGSGMDLAWEALCFWHGTRCVSGMGHVAFGLVASSWLRQL